MSVSLHPHDEAQVYIGARYNGEIYDETVANVETYDSVPLKTSIA